MGNEKNSFKIGEAARRAGVNKETIRYYERREIISEPGRMKSGYRIFTRRHVDQIQFIKRAQDLGFTLSEIKELLALRLDGDIPCEQVRVKAQAKFEDVRQKIKDLNRIHSVLSELIEECKADGTTEDCVILNALEGERDHDL